MKSTRYNMAAARVEFANNSARRETPDVNRHVQAS